MIQPWRRIPGAGIRHGPYTLEVDENRRCASRLYRNAKLLADAENRGHTDL